ncbi:CORD and CS domain-containing protein [Lojkania enalia]|uniref:CORD and CS domain-containing protein n=1 Tax=Lojkania enalia TaxID=147567 RepID=A0A9P4KHZ6_9PLEO|nr:CORD and CS domain-containing protein [Didymosphaeria enalia]
MAKKCVHKGCGKVYEDDNEDCVYHPGPPKFHEGQKGWECCKPRVLTFDEFLAIPPCTTGKHSEVDDTPKPEPVKAPDIPNDTPINLGSLDQTLPVPAPRIPVSQPVSGRASPAPPPESEDDDPSISIKEGQSCRRRGCGKTYNGSPREGEQCVYHSGAPIFHEGSKGWSCCKRRVLEFDQFMNIEGCKTKDRHLFVGSGKKGMEEKVDTVRHDFYQTGTSVIASLYLKKISKDTALVEFKENSVVLDLHTSDSKRYQTEMPLWGSINAENSKFRILGTKLELTLAKADGAAWPVLRADDKLTGEVFQVGRAGRV